MKFKLFISDFDGTLGVSKTNSIPDPTLEAINKYTEKGGIFAVCTGRMFASIRPILLKYQMKGLVISYQGAMINDIETGNSLNVDGLDTESAVAVVEEFERLGLDYFFDVDDSLYYPKRTQYIEIYEDVCKVPGSKVDNSIEFIRKKAKPIQKVCATCKREIIEKLLPVLNEKFGGKVLFNSGAEFLLEAINPKLSKGFAVDFLADYYSIDKSEIIAVGDSGNDVELVKGEHYGVAVGTSVPELKAVAKEVTVDFCEHPVKVLLEKYCLND